MLERPSRDDGAVYVQAVVVEEVLPWVDEHPLSSSTVFR